MPSSKLAFFALTLVAAAACGGASTSSRVATHGPADAGADVAVLQTTPSPTGLPPMSPMPPPGVIGSKKAKVRLDTALATCSGAVTPQSKDPADVVKKIGDGCAAAAKMKPIGNLLRGVQADREAHQNTKLRAEANHCYRLYVASDDAARDVVAVVRDSAGDIVAEAPAPAIPARGAMCFQTNDDITIGVSVGNGKGAWAAQLWGD